ncbi:MAG: choice-of-anchor J domain-containing protein [Pseudomonadota bacterium]|nr:choice-of-anchor J domain-containing protein [Pseudomonadota bacterium]
MSLKHAIAHAGRASLAAALVLGCCSGAAAATLSENFDTVIPAGWTVVNNSVPLGPLNWGQGDPDAFPAQAGAANSYAAVNYQSGSSVANLSDWLITPTLSFNNGDTLSFFTRTVDGVFAPDRLEVRFSNIGGTNVGTTASSVGSFDMLLLSINPDLTLTGYPEAWTQYSYTFSGLAGATNGAVGFRYYVTNGGPLGANSDYIGLDTVRITAGAAAVPEPASWLLLAAGLAACGVLRARAKRDNMR